MRRLHWEDFAALAPQMSARPAARRLDRRRRARAARRLYRSHLHHAAAVAGGIRPELCGARRCCAACSSAPWRACKFPPAFSSERFGAARGAGARHRARRSRLLLRRREHRLRHAAWRAVDRRLGASAQHPIASALVARAFAGPRSLKALGTYNFAGDLGKMTLPAALSLMLLAMPWRPALAILGSVGIVVAAVIFVATPRFERGATAARGGRAAQRATSASRAAVRAFPSAARDRHYRQRHAHGIFAVSAVRAARTRARACRPSAWR